MDDIAERESITPAQRGARARAALEAYSGTITDLITDLAHLADDETTGGALATLRDAEMHYGAELPDIDPPAPGAAHPLNVFDLARAAAKLLGDGWTVHAADWGAAGYLDFQGEPVISVGLNEDLDLFVRHEDLPKGTEVLEGASDTDALNVLAERVADTVRDLCARNAEAEGDES
ncbi:hypothetical protein [Streptomyces sp. NBC_00268]|uniref:hypothetical protein n=1 Tax=Streptomyces sp. NBC_00268 TaxID=2975695 RepID=UPI002257FAB7|nr:hypothetical protein [Streptomyces sp. NBC_00268]MCX5182591.1 hypothetical protein [Streptomyces sp. NBC_00268]